tara:strand:- start:3521 stop:5350 length:1830 start_codon:yes stop_codon:yes gene_type:complete
MARVINLNFTIDGNKVLEPVNWQDLTEVFEYGQNSNQPSIEAESFTFQGDSAQLILDHFHPNGMLKPGNILVPLDVNIVYTQQGVKRKIIDDYVIDTVKGVQLNDTWFNNQFKPKEVVCNIRKKIGADYFRTEIQGLDWGLLLEEKAVTSSDLTTIRTIVAPPYNFLEVVMALFAIFQLQKQLRETISEIAKDVADIIQKIGSATGGGVTASILLAIAIIYKIAVLAIKVAGAIFQLAILIKMTLDMILLILPPVLKNKGITLRRGMEIICTRLGYDFEAKNLPILDQVCYMPSGAHSEGKNLIKNNLPNWFANERGVPNDYDYGYICVNFVELVKKIVNGRIDVNKSTVTGNPTVFLRNENDPALFVSGSYQHRIDPNYTNVEYNISEIPHTRLLTFDIDPSDSYTTEYQQARMWEVKNIANTGNLTFSGFEPIDFNVSLGKRKSTLNVMEKLILELAGIADKIAKLLGGNPKLKQSIQGKRTGVLMVSQNNFSNPKLIPIAGLGKMPANYLGILSAETIEAMFYVNRSIVRGTGQKLILKGIEVPMSLADRDKIKNNGNFKDPYWGDSTFRIVEYNFSKDTAICDIAVDNDYIASNTFTEISYNGLQ